MGVAPGRTLLLIYWNAESLETLRAGKASRRSILGHKAAPHSFFVGRLQPIHLQFIPTHSCVKLPSPAASLQRQGFNDFTSHATNFKAARAVASQAYLEVLNPVTHHHPHYTLDISISNQ